VAELVGGEPDAVRLVAQVAAPGLPALTAGRSAFAAVRRLDGGTAVRFGTGSGREWRYEPLLPHRGGSFETAADRLRVALTAAVRLRVATAGQVTADFSGGLDSTSLAFLAAGQAPEVQGFTYHNPLAPADDLRYARRCAPLHPALRHRVVLGSADSLNFADLHLPAAPADEPDVGVLLARTPCRLAPVAAAGSDLHLVGDGGDALLTAPYGYLADLLRRGHVRRAHRDATVLARRWRQAPAALLARAARLSTVSRRQAYTELAEAWERPAPTPRPLAAASPIGWWPAPGPEVGWFTGHARADLVELALARAGEPARAGGVADFVTGQELAANAADHRLFRDAGADRWGVPLHAPFFDHEVVRACLAVPAARRADPPAAKPLLVRALDGLVPGEVLHRATKGDYTAETYQGLRRAAAVLRTLFVEPRLADLGLIEPGPVRESLDRATLGLPMPLPSLERLVAAEVWLRARENDGVIPEPEAAHG
jgi:asparagine synthase (glutamine-hydrolysing)